jgi:hypothetical protein
MIDWIEPMLELPPQGKKILYFRKGDCSVRQRFDNYWVPIPYVDSQYCDFDPPQLWKDIELPGTFTGLMHVEVDGTRYTIDELEKAYPEAYNLMVEMQLALHQDLTKDKK